MKKLLTAIAAVVLAGTVGYSQGLITIANTAAGYLITTNGTSVSLGTGAAGTGANSYYYAVLMSAYGGPTPGTNLYNPSVLSQWAYTGVSAANNALTRGGIGTPSSTTAASPWAAPTGATYNTGTIMYYLIVGWSANEGTSWLTVSNSLATGSWNATGAGSWFGWSALAYNYAGGGPSSLPTVNLLNAPAQTGLAGAGMTSGFSLLPVPVPEPTTMALAGLGGLSLLLLRRRKQ